MNHGDVLIHLPHTPQTNTAPLFNTPSSGPHQTTKSIRPRPNPCASPLPLLFPPSYFKKHPPPTKLPKPLLILLPAPTDMSRRPGRNGTTAPTRSGEPFARSFEHWLHQLDQDLRSLRSAAEAQYAQDTRDGALLRPLVDRVVSHYESYCRSKSASAKLNVLPMFSPTWTSSTENLFLWVGGWRPSVAFHLLYSKSGLQLDSQLDKLIAGLPTHDLSNLSPDQLARIDRLQRKTIRLEKEISEEEAAVQETVANARMVELTEAITEEGGGAERMGPEMEKKEEGMVTVLERADRLRLETLKGVIEILQPTQAVHFLLAAAELQLRVHEFGKKKDEEQRAGSGSPVT